MHKNIGILEFNTNILETSYKGGAIDVDVMNKAIQEIKDVIKDWKDVAILIYKPEDVMYRAKDKKLFIPHGVAVDVCDEIQHCGNNRVTVTWEEIDSMTIHCLEKWNESRSD